MATNKNNATNAAEAASEDRVAQERLDANIEQMLEASK